MSRLWLIVLVTVMGCKERAKNTTPGANAPGEKKGAAALVGNMGTRVAAGGTTDLRASPDGHFLTYLKDAEKPRLEGVPTLMKVGELWVVPSEGGEPRKLGNGVSNFPGGYLFSSDSQWVLSLIGYNAAEQVGELQAFNVASPGAQKVRLGGSVSYMLASPDSKWVAFVDGGVLKVGPLPTGPFREVAGEVSNAQFTPDSTGLFFKRKAAAAGGLLYLKVDSTLQPTRLAELVGDYKLTPNGQHVVFTTKTDLKDRAYRLLTADVLKLKAKELSAETFAFGFSPDGKWLARIEGFSPEAGGRLVISMVDGSGADRKLGDSVKEFTFTRDGSKIAWRDHYAPGDKNEGVGDLSITTLPTGEVKLLKKHCTSYEWSPDGQSLAFVAKVFRPLVSADLWVLTPASPEPVSVKNWVYDYDFTLDSKRLLFRSDCVREGRACNLLSWDVARPAEPARKLVEGVFGFKLASAGPRALFTYARMQGGDVYDTGVINLSTNEYQTVEQLIRMPPVFLDAQGTRVAYIVADPKREGVYVASKGVP